MPIELFTQAGTAKAPPIPPMDVSPAPASSGRDIARQVTSAVRQATAAARQQARATAAQSQGTTTPTTASGTLAPPSSNDDLIPQGAVDISIAFFVCVAACVIFTPFARAMARFVDRRAATLKSDSPHDLTPQVRQLQDSVDALAIEMERISEGQRFTAKLLADRAEASK